MASADAIERTQHDGQAPTPSASAGDSDGRTYIPPPMQPTDDEPHADAHWDAGHTGCGELVVDLRTRMRALEPRQVLRLVAHDPGAREDIPAWCGMTGHALVHAAHPVYLIRRKDH